MNEKRLVALSQKLISKNGRHITFKKLSTQTTGKPWQENIETYDTSKERTLLTCVVPASSGFSKDIVSEELISRSSEVMLLAPTDIDMSLHNVVIDGGVTWKIEWVKVLRPANEILLYVFGVKQ